MYYHVHITPEWDKDTVSAFNIICQTDFAAKAGTDMAARILELVKIPFCPIDIPVFSDELGEIPYSTHNGEAEQSFIFRQFYRAERDTKGEITISYRITPRIQPEGYRSSPYFDLVAEKGGVQGSGTTFLLHLPNMNTEIDFRLSWDLSKLPEGSRAVWTFGSGDSEKHCAVQLTLFSAYMVGLVKAVEEGVAGFYWFDELPFDANEGATQITTMFNYMSKMFHDKGGEYRVFTRHNHFHGGGGTAFPRSYIYAYGEGDHVTISGLQSLLAHEMVHNWPHLPDDPAGLGTWYVEGSAEYYSVMVPLEMGIRSVELAAEDINEKAGSYYKNPLMGLSNLELGKIYWSDRRAQRVPYARGVLYLSNLDAAIRRATNGKNTLLDLEVALLEMQNPTNEDFLRIGSEFAGFDLRPGFEEMCKGGMIIPDPEAFGGRFNVKPCKVKLNNAQHRSDVELLDTDADGYIWTAKS